MGNLSLIVSYRLSPVTVAKSNLRKSSCHLTGLANIPEVTKRA